MDFSILLAMLGLGVAVVSLLPPRTKLSILFKINWLDKLIWFLALFLIHYVAFAPVLFELGLLLPLGEWQYGFEPRSFTYVIFLFLTAFTTYRIISSKLTRKNIERFKDLSEQLLFEKRFNELTSMLERHLPELFELSSKENEYARMLCIRLFTSKELVNFISVSKPNLGISIMTHDFATKERFVALFMECLLDNQGSIFYYEMNIIQNTITRHRFEIPESCRLSSTLFRDIEVSENLGIYKPIGDKLLRVLVEDDELISRNNEALLSFCENEREASVIECGLHFFEIMVLEAMHQKANWHMWLYYLPFMAKEILKSVNPSIDVDLTKEWPTPSHYFIYRILDINFTWIDEFQNVEGYEELSFNDNSLRHDNASIQKSAILSVGQILWLIVAAENLDDKFKRNCLDTALRKLRDLKAKNGLEDSYLVLKQSILFQGFMNKRDKHVLNEYKRIISKIDHILRLENEDFIGFLNETIEQL